MQQAYQWLIEALQIMASTQTALISGLSKLSKFLVSERCSMLP